MLVALLVTSLVASLLVVAAPQAASPAGAQDPPPGVTTSTNWPTDCVGVALGVEQMETNNMAFQVTAPAQVAPGDTFTIRIAPQESAFPNTNVAPPPIHEVTLFNLQNIQFMYNVPTNSTVQSVQIVEGSGFGTTGTPTVHVDTTSYSPNRIILSVPEVPKNAVPPTLETFFQLPAVDVTVQATGPIGSNISTRFSGFNRPTSGYIFQSVTNAATADVTCWPAGEVPSPLMSQTAISSGSVTTPTTTELAVAPTVLPGGNPATMTATVTAPSGVVRFNDGATVLGFAELDEEGVAVLTAPLNNVGARTITASYLGSAGFEASVSPGVPVTVTDPNDRVRPQIQIAANPAVINLGNTGTEGSTQVTVTLAPPTGEFAVPTGQVILYDNGLLVGSSALIEGSAQFSATLTTGSHQMSAVYSGDINFFSASGSTVVAAVNSSGTGSPTVNVAVSGSIDLNAVDGSIPGSSLLSSSFRTDEHGVQTMDGTLRFPSATYAAPGGSVTGRLATIGQVSGLIEAGSDGAASLSTDMFFVVSSADLGSGEVQFGSSCVVGPFSVELEGSRSGTNGPVTLAASSFGIGFPQAGSCVTPTGASLATQVGGAFAGISTSLDIAIAAPPAGVPVIISDVTTDPGVTSYGQPVTLTVTVSTDGGPNFPNNGGDVSFWAGDTFLRAVSIGGGTLPSKVVSLTVPTVTDGLSPAVLPLPEGINTLRAQFSPRVGSKLVFADSPLSAPSNHTVLPAVPKNVPTLTLGLPDTAPATEPVSLELQLSPAPNSIAPEDVPLEGAIFIYDDNDENYPIIPITSVSNQTPLGCRGALTRDCIAVTSDNDGVLSAETALAPGVHALRALFVPSVATAWKWSQAESPIHVHDVTGEPVATHLDVLEESTRGTGNVRAGFNLYIANRVSPAVVGSAGPWSSSMLSLRPWVADPPPAEFQADGTTGSQAMVTTDLEPGEYEINQLFDPSYLLPGQFQGLSIALAGASNRGFAPSAVGFDFEVVEPGVGGPMETGTEIVSVNPSPVSEGQTWSQVNGYVTYGATGTVAYTARHVESGTSYNLGTGNVSTSTSASSGRGLARVSNPAITSTFPAGTYEVRGTYTPSDPALFQGSSSEVFIVHVVGDDAIESATALSVTPSGTTEPGQPIALDATVSPSWAGGNVQFVDGDDPIGDPIPTLNGVASRLVFDLAEGEHQLSAVFTPTDPAVVEGSSSVLVPHTVAEPTVPTATGLVVDPEDTSLQGEDVTLTATVEPSGAVGSVFFEDEVGELGEVELVDGNAQLILDDLEPGTHQIQAVFEPDPETDFETSASEVVEHTVIAQDAPDAPDGVTATSGGLMATVTWDEPEDDGGQSVDSYTVTASPGGATLQVTADVTTVNVLGLTAGEDYSFTVTATNSIGTSPPSAPSNTITVGPAEHPFNDVPSSHPFFAEITWMAETGLSTGFEDDTFQPNATLTRQAMSAFIYRINGAPNGPDPTCTTMPFVDVPVDHPFCGEISWMADEGISTGFDDDTYRPNTGLTRQAMSAFLYRSANGPTPPPVCTIAPFTDVPTTNEFCPQIAWMAQTGISEGFPGGEFRPTADLTRQAMSAFLYRYTLVVQTPVV